MNNPYAPPESRGESPSWQEDWYTEGTTIFVSDGAALPAIDLETGEVSEDLIQVRRKFAIAGATLGLWGMIPALRKLLPKEWGDGLHPTGNGIVILIAALSVLFILHCYIALRRPGLLGKCVRFTTHRNAELERKRKRSKTLLIIWFCLSVIGPAGVLLAILFKMDQITTLSLPSIISVMGISVASMLGAAIWQRFHPPKIKFKDFSGKWLRVDGACDEALAHLRKIESERSIHHAA
jgi:hypothetical protein